MELSNTSPLLLLVFTFLFSSDISFGIRIQDPTRNQASFRPVKVAVFALGSLWRSEAAFGCIPGVVRTSVGYSGGSKSNPEFRNLGDHAECVQVEYDPNVIQYKQLLNVFWASHDSRQVFGQGPDVGNQYRSIIFTNGTLEARLAAASKEREQTKSRNSIVTTQIQHLGAFHPAESDHQICLEPTGWDCEIPKRLSREIIQLDGDLVLFTWEAPPGERLEHCTLAQGEVCHVVINMFTGEEESGIRIEPGMSKEKIIEMYGKPDSKKPEPK